jgi:crotonobetainyl-CoA:carnitine CoA-transferase CaiB-like acyl-CoA transferase
MAGALDGIRVIDFGQWIAGPSALLCDQGAEVIHGIPVAHAGRRRQMPPCSESIASLST